MSTREQQIDGLRKLADLLEQNPDVSMPYDVANGLTFQFLYTEEAASEMAHLRSLIGGAFRKNTYGGGTYYELVGKFSGIEIRLVTFRSKVCERVVVGTREVYEEIPDPDAPKVAVIKTVEDVEWRCSPVLAEIGGVS